MRPISWYRRSALLLLGVITLAIPDVLPIVDAREPVTVASIESHHDPVRCLYHHHHEACVHHYGAAPLPGHAPILALASHPVLVTRARLWIDLVHGGPLLDSAPRAPPSLEG
jgi:hypothetical protein